MSISESSMSYFDQPPQIRWGTTSTSYLRRIAAEMPTVPGRRRMMCHSRLPSGRMSSLRASRWKVTLM